MNTAKIFLGKTYRHFMLDSLYRNSVFLVLNTAVTSLIGLLFWTIAARTYSSADVGVASAIISASSFLSVISYLGFDYSLIKYIPISKNIRLKLGTAFTITGISSILAAVAYLIVSPISANNYKFLIGSVTVIFFFIFMILMTTWNGLTNTVLITFRITKYIAIATLISGLLKILLVFAFNSYDEIGLLIAHTTALTVSVIISFIYIKKHCGYTFKPLINRVVLIKTARFSIANYSASIAGNIPLLILPVLILRYLDAEQAAYFYIVVMVVALLNVVSQAINLSLFAEGSWDKNSFNEQSKKSFRTVLSILIPSILVYILLGKYGLSIFGKDYAQYGYVLLIFLSLSSVPKAINQISGTYLRVHNYIKPLIIITCIGTLITVGLTYVALINGKGLTYIGLAILLSDLLVAGIYIYTIRIRYYNKSYPGNSPTYIIESKTS